MKRFSFFPALIFGLALVVLSACGVGQHAPQEVSTQSKVREALERIPEIQLILPIEAGAPFEEGYEFYFEQHTNPFDTTSPTFLQRVQLGHTDFNKPMIVELEGYNLYDGPAGELTDMFGANQLRIEHRYFGKSNPEGETPWTSLTIRNAAEDHHRIIQALKKVLYSDQSWLSTGISKGGQTTLIHRSFHPEDVDASVCYVAPLNFEREDHRIHDFLKTVGTAEQREKIREFQLLCLRRKNELVKELEKKMKERAWSWDFPTDVAFDYYTLEYSFAFWQWGAYSFDQIPTNDAPPSEILNHLLTVSGVSFFEKSGVEELRSYFYTAMTEEGIYDYDTTGFSQYLSKDVYNFEFTLPKGFEQVSFDPVPMSTLFDFLQEEANNMLFIYGEKDPWSATAVELPQNAADRGLYKYLAKGNHATRIGSFSEAEQKEMLKILEGWLKR